MSLESLIEHYGYAALLVGTFLEGETILVIAGFAAHRGYLSLPWVIVCAFVGSLVGDQLWFYIGRRQGLAFIAARPRWSARVAKLNRLLARFEWPVVLGFRFAYGLRSITPFVLGASGYAATRFAFFNTLGAALWSLVVGVAGYVFGHALELLIDDVKRYERWALLIIVLIGIALWLWRTFSKRPTSKSDTAEVIATNSAKP